MPNNSVASSPWFIPVRRAVVLWILGRIALLLLAPLLSAALGLGDPFESSKPRAQLAISLATVVAVIVVIDLRATREDILLANLGVGQRHSALLAAGSVIVIELMLGSLAALASL